MPDAMIDPNERRILRELAKTLADLAADPVHAENIALWKDFTALRSRRPMVLCFPEGGMVEVLPESSLVCQSPPLRRMEWILRERIWHADALHDDHPLTDVWHVGVQVRRGDLGMVEHRHGGEGRGAWAWEPPLTDPADVRKLHIRDVEVDWDATAADRALAEDVFGDILSVRVDRSPRPTGQFARDLILLRGNQQLLLDMYDNPSMLHDILEVLRASALHEIDVLQREGAYRLNNRPEDYLDTGGIGCTDELPGEGFDGKHVRSTDLWGLVENQELAGVGPDQVHEFAVQYEAAIAERSGLVSYGCCEAVHMCLDMLIESLPNLRALSVAPWCDRRIAAERLGGDYMYQWKPNPALVCSPTAQWQAAEQDIRETLAITRPHGCHVAIVLKDTHTFAGDPSRPVQWVQLARRCVEQAMG